MKSLLYETQHFKNVKVTLFCGRALAWFLIDVQVSEFKISPTGFLALERPFNYLAVLSCSFPTAMKDIYRQPLQPDEITDLL